MNYPFIVAQAFRLNYTITHAQFQSTLFSTILSTSMLMISFWRRFEWKTLTAGQATLKPTALRDSNQSLKCASLIFRRETRQPLSQFISYGLQSIIARLIPMIAWSTTRFIGLRMMGSHPGLSLLILLILNHISRQKLTQMRIWASRPTNSWFKHSIRMVWDLIQLCIMHRSTSHRWVYHLYYRRHSLHSWVCVCD
jgi:hypothetical protein